MIHIENCDQVPRSIRKTVSASVPTQTASSSHNPSSVSTEKGLGVESLVYDGIGIGVVTGTGRVGASMSSSSPENTFFGNHAFELKNEVIDRKEQGLQYDAKKLALSTAVNVFSVKSKKVPIKLNLGLTLKRHSDIETVNWGTGASLMMGPLSVGYSFYFDDQKWSEINSFTYRIFNETTLIPTYYTLSGDVVEKFTVKTLSVGMKYSFFAGDYINLVTEYKDSPDTKQVVDIYNATFIGWGSMFTVGRRHTSTNRSYYDTTTAAYIEALDSWETLLAYQYSFDKNWLAGAMYNYHLHNGFTLLLTYFL